MRLTSGLKPAVLAMALLALCGPASAQEFVGDLCRPVLAATPPRYDTPEHSRWYKRFWTGQCDRLVGCFPGSPNWSEIVGKLLAKGGPAERSVLLPKACRLGQLTGVEWSRARTIKRITTADLRVLYGQLEAAKDPIKGVDQVEAVVRGKLSGASPAR